MSTAFGDIQINVTVEDTAAGTDATHPVHRATRQMDVRNVYLATKTAITVDAADYLTITLQVGSTVIATLATNATALVANTFAAMTVADADKRIADEADITLVVANTGSTGVALDNVNVQIEADAAE